MAIKSFKEILDNKGYRISSKDRQIFEEGTLQSFFGFSDSDMIEFILYDANDNQLPQGEFGELVKYIPFNSQNIRDYILIPEGTYLQAFQFPKEYFIDVERLIREAGYNNGIFKTQITLLNKRVGFESPNEKLWIKEISPSRTEVKLLPLRNDIGISNFKFYKNHSEIDGVIQGEENHFYLDYNIVDIFVSRACGFINNYIDLSALNYDPNIFGAPNGVWISGYEVINQTVENENQAHVNIFH